MDPGGPITPDARLSRALRPLRVVRRQFASDEESRVDSASPGGRRGAARESGARDERRARDRAQRSPRFEGDAGLGSGLDRSAGPDLSAEDLPDLDRSVAPRPPAGALPDPDRSMAPDPSAKAWIPTCLSNPIPQPGLSWIPMSPCRRQPSRSNQVRARAPGPSVARTRPCFHPSNQVPDENRSTPRRRRPWCRAFWRT